MRVTKVVNFTVATFITIYDALLVMDFDSSPAIYNLTNPVTKVEDFTPKSMKLAFILVVFAFGILQIRLERQNYRFGEGFFVILERWWTDTHQGETHENEEFGVNFQRIMLHNQRFYSYFICQIKIF